MVQPSNDKFMFLLTRHRVGSVPGARVNAKDNMWLTPLHRAVASRSEVSAQILLPVTTAGAELKFS